MPRDSSGNYTLPAGNPVITGATITSDWANDTMGDMGNEMTNSLSRDGQGGMLAPLQFVDGSSLAPGISFVLEPTLGWYRKATSVIALAATGADQMQYDGINHALSIYSALANVAGYAIRDSAGLIRFIAEYNDANGAVTIARNNDAGVLETLLAFTNDGNVSVNGAAPVNPSDLTRKSYVDAQFTVGANLKVSKTGDTMTGQLNGIEPVDLQNMTTKSYVDTRIEAIGGSVLDRVLRTGDTMTGQLGLLGGGAGSEAAQVVQITDAITVHDNAPNPHAQYLTQTEANALYDPLGSGTTDHSALNNLGNDDHTQYYDETRGDARYERLAEKGVQNGYAPLNASVLVSPVFLPFTQIEFYGTWDASPGILPPTPVSGGAYYIISVSGTLNVVPADGSSTTPTPTVVAVGDDIFYSAITDWWYQVVPSHLQNDARYLQLAGGNMTGQINGITPTAAANLTRKDYIDGLDVQNVKLTGAQIIAGVKTFSSNPLSSQAQQNAVSALTRKDYVDGKVAKTGDSMSGQLTGITPVSAADLTRKDYVDGGVNQAISDANAANNNANTRVLRTGDTMTGQLNGINPTAAANMTRKDYVDNAIAVAVAAAIAQLQDLPIGTLEFGWNPNGVYAGTWTQWPEGTFLMNTVGGADPSGGNNNAVTITHTHTATQPAHTHSGGIVAGAAYGNGGNQNHAAGQTGSSAPLITVSSAGVSGTNLNKPLYKGVAVWERTS